jgi:hypothetical protein
MNTPRQPVVAVAVVVAVVVVVIVVRESHAIENKLHVKTDEIMNRRDRK